MSEIRRIHFTSICFASNVVCHPGELIANPSIYLITTFHLFTILSPMKSGCRVWLFANSARVSNYSEMLIHSFVFNRTDYICQSIWIRLHLMPNHICVLVNSETLFEEMWVQTLVHSCQPLSWRIEFRYFAQVCSDHKSTVSNVRSQLVWIDAHATYWVVNVIKSFSLLSNPQCPLAIRRSQFANRASFIHCLFGTWDSDWSAISGWSHPSDNCLITNFKMITNTNKLLASNLFIIYLDPHQSYRVRVNFLKGFGQSHLVFLTPVVVCCKQIELVMVVFDGLCKLVEDQSVWVVGDYMARQKCSSRNMC